MLNKIKKRNITLLFAIFWYLTGITNTIKAATENINSVAVAVLQNSKPNEDLKALMKEAKLHKEQGRKEQALKLYLTIINKAETANNLLILQESHSEVAQIFREIKNYSKALDYNKNALFYSNKLKDSISIIEKNLSLSSNHFHLYIQDSIQYKNSLDSLFFYNNNASNYIGNNPNFLQQKADQYNGLSIIYFLKGQHNKAQSYVKKALNIQVERKDTLGQVICMNTLAGNYIRLKNYNQAEHYYQQALNLLKSTDGDRKSNLRRMINSNLAWTYYKTKNFIAYEYLNKANKISDSLRNAEFDAIITEIEAKHNVDIIKQNAAKKQLIQIQEKKRFQLIIIGLAISLTILILIFWIYTKNAKLKDENKDLLIEKTRLMKEKQIEHIESLTRIKILNATLDGKEAERRQIAETLHDSVSALLSAANLHLQASKNKVIGKIPIEIDKTQTIIDEASGKIRNLSHELISSVLLKFGLSYAIQDFCEKYSNTDLEITASTENLQRYDESFEIKTNNIIEELVNNLIKHSKATEGHVNVMEYRKNLHVEIEDNGVGFDTSKKIESNGIGIHQIEARIKMMKGSFKIHSVMGEGTRIEFTIPITYRSEEYSYSQSYS